MSFDPRVVFFPVLDVSKFLVAFFAWRKVHWSRHFFSPGLLLFQPQRHEDRDRSRGDGVFFSVVEIRKAATPWAVFTGKRYVWICLNEEDTMSMMDQWMFIDFQWNLWLVAGLWVGNWLLIIFTGIDDWEDIPTGIDNASQSNKTLSIFARW